MNDMNDNYRCGRENEEFVAKIIEKHFQPSSVSLSPGSRGSSDVTAKFTTRKNWGVQVKSTCVKGGKPKRLTEKERNRLIKDCNKKNQIPIYASVKDRTVKLTNASNNRVIKIPEESCGEKIAKLILVGGGLWIGGQLIRSIIKNRTRLN